MSDPRTWKKPDPLLVEFVDDSLPDPQLTPEDRRALDRVGGSVELVLESFNPDVEGNVPGWFPRRDAAGQPLSENRRARLFHQALEWGLGDRILDSWSSLSAAERKQSVAQSLLLMFIAMETGNIPIPGL